jgi:hypothetical protein
MERSIHCIRIVGSCVRRVCGLLLLVGVHLLSAQARPAVSTGALVRITHTAACCDSPVVGTLVAIEPDSLRLVSPFRLQSSKPLAVLPRGSVVSIEVGRRLGAHKAVGASIGLLAGGFSGAIIGSQGLTREYRSAGGVLGAAAGALLGALVGTVVGSAIPHYQWTPAQLSPKGS